MKTEKLSPAYKIKVQLKLAMVAYVRGIEVVIGVRLQI